ncbi:MAG: transglutaminase family protein [Deltaproteobacteria bacterium]|nr:transglutaminase family protein [Deltaproteobacteria bacterium]
MTLRTLLAAALAFSSLACTKTADTAATSTSSTAGVEPGQPQAASHPQAAAEQPDVLTLKRPAGGEWMGLYLQGKKAGWAFTDVKGATFDGQPAVEAISDVALSATIGGAKTEREMHEERYYQPRNGGLLIGVQIDKTGDGGEEHIHGVRKGNQLELTITRPGRAAETRTMPASAETIEQADAPRLALAKHIKVAGKAFDEDDLVDKGISTEVGTPSTVVNAGVTVKVQRTITIDDKDKLPTTISFDDQGRTVDARFGEPPVMVGKAEPEATAKKLEEVDLFALTRVVLDRAPEQAAFGDHPTLTMKVKGLPKEFQKDASRQSYKAAPDGDTLITIAGHPPKGNVSRPVKSTAELKEWLEPTRQVESNDPSIMAAAKSVAGGETDAWIASQKLSHWVNQALTKAYGASSDRASDVLARKTGDCTEHALLFTAMARSLGIPARRVDGLVYMGVDGQPPALYWHEWAEVWVGEWIAIDPTFDESIADATHLALGEEGRADSAALIGQLAITVAK